jgi:type II secretory pathway component GspD/PulD (secretin)
MAFASVRPGVLIAALVLALTLTVAPASAAPADSETKDKAAGPAEKIRKALDQPITVDINEQPLTHALNQIREQTKINFVVDRMLIQQMGYDPEQMPVSAKLKDARARTCLRAVLGPYNLGYAIIGDTVLISTDDMVMQRQMKQRVSIDLDKVDLAAALKQLSRETATNLLLDSRVPAKDGKTTVSLQLEDVPLDTAIRLVAEAGGLKPVQVGNVMLVTTKALANEMRNDPELMTGAQTPQQEIQMLQQKRMLMLQQQQFAPPIFQPVNPPPPPPAEKPAESGDKPGEGEKKVEKPDRDK